MKCPSPLYWLEDWWSGEVENLLQHQSHTLWILDLRYFLSMGGNRTVSLRKVQCIGQGLGPVWFSDIPTWKVSCRGGMCLLCHYFVCLMRHNVKGTVSPRLKCSYSCTPPQDNVRKKYKKMAADSSFDIINVSGSYLHLQHVVKVTKPLQTGCQLTL